MAEGLASCLLILNVLFSARLPRGGVSHFTALIYYYENCRRLLRGS